MKRADGKVEPSGRMWRRGANQCVHGATTGAGDALAAGFIVGGIELGLATAARCVAQLGAVPA